MCPTDSDEEETLSRVHGEGRDMKGTVFSLAREMESGQDLRLMSRGNGIHI